MSADQTPVVITGIGMRTAVGNNAVQTCASIRCGINRFREWPHLGAGFGEDGAALIASATQPDLGNSSWVDKTLELIMQPLYEVLWSAELYDYPALLSKLGVCNIGAYLATPYRDRPGVTEADYREFAVDARQHCISVTQAQKVELMPLEHAGGLAALAMAVDELQDGVIDIAVVGGIDSFLETEFLGTLLDAGRLKIETTSSGVIPGEGVAFVVLERLETAQRRGIPPLARIGSVARDTERVPLVGREPSKAEGLSRAVNAAIDDGGGPQDLHVVIADLNGERARFLEWALVDSRCLHALPTDRELWHPADCVGDVGAAFGPLAMGLAVRGFARGFAGRGGALLCSSSVRGERAAATIFPV